MDRRALLRRKLKRIAESLPPPPLSYPELHVEAWVDDEMRNALDVATVERSSHEEYFYRWLDELPVSLHRAISLKVLEARGELWSIYDPIPPLPKEVAGRVAEALPPWIEHHRKRWIGGFPHREARRRWVKEMDAQYSGDGRGREWMARLEKEYARLAEKYAGWEEAWDNYYQEWKAERGLPSVVRDA